MAGTALTGGSQEGHDHTGDSEGDVYATRLRQERVCGIHQWVEIITFNPPTVRL